MRRSWRLRPVRARHSRSRGVARAPTAPKWRRATRKASVASCGRPAWCSARHDEDGNLERWARDFVEVDARPVQPWMAVLAVLAVGRRGVTDGP